MRISTALGAVMHSFTKMSFLFVIFKTQSTHQWCQCHRGFLVKVQDGLKLVCLHTSRTRPQSRALDLIQPQLNFLHHWGELQPNRIVSNYFHQRFRKFLDQSKQFQSRFPVFLQRIFASSSYNQ